MASITYNSFKKNLLTGVFDLESDTINLALVTSDYTPNIDTHEFWDDVTHEVAGTGYTAGGKELQDKSVTQDNDGDQGVWDAEIVVWANSVLTARGAVLYKDTGNAATSPLIRYFDFGMNYTTDGGAFNVSWPANGILVAWP